MRIPCFIIKATAVASIGGILFGYDLGVISGALPQLTESFDLTETQQEWVVGILYLGGGLGAAVGGHLTDFCGRKTAILLCDIVFMVGALLLYCANSVAHLYLGRVVVGFGISVSGIADVAYLHELAPLEWRGSIVSVNEACISLGFMIAFCVGYLLRQDSDGWRAMFGFSGYLAMIQLLLMWTMMPESPVWLKQKGREEEQQEVLQKMYGNTTPPAIFPELVDAEHEQETRSPLQHEQRRKSGAAGRGTSREHLVELGEEAANSYESTMEDELADEYNDSYEGSLEEDGSLAWRAALLRWRRQAYIALFLAVAQQLSGQTSVLSYAPLIFSAVAPDSDTEPATLYIGFFKFIVTVVVIWRIEYMGRKCLLLSGMGTIVVGQACIALAFYLGIGQDENQAAQQQPGALLAVGGALLVVMGYSASFGPLTWLLTSELFPAIIRGRALGVSTIATYLFASLTTSTFLSMQSWMGSSAVFALYGGVTLLGMIFVSLAIPDSGGKSAEEIDACLRTMWWWRRRHTNEHCGSRIVLSTSGKDGAVRLPETELT